MEPDSPKIYPMSNAERLAEAMANADAALAREMDGYIYAVIRCKDLRAIMAAAQKK